MPEVRTCAKDGCEQTFVWTPGKGTGMRKYCDDHKTSVKWGAKPKSEPLTNWKEPAAVSDPEPASSNGELRPSAPEETTTQKVKGLRSLWAPKEKPATNGTGERKPAVPKRRHGTADFWGGAVGIMAGQVARSNYVPLARAMTWSSPVAGDIIEEATKGTIIDSAVQPFCRSTQKWEDLFDLIGFWGAIGMAQQQPAMAPAALDFARRRMVKLLPRMAAKIKAERKKEAEAAQALYDLMPDLNELFPDGIPGNDPVGALIGSLFAMSPEQEMADSGAA